MCAQQKKNGWFFNKKIIDEINAVPEEVVSIEDEKVMPISSKLAEKQRDEINEVKRLILEKEQMFEQYKQESALENRRLNEENANYRQTIMTMEEEAIQRLNRIRDLEIALQNASASSTPDAFLRELNEAKEELEQMRESLHEYDLIKSELEEMKQRYSDLIVCNSQNEKKNLDVIRGLEEEVGELKEQLNKSGIEVDRLNKLVTDYKEKILIQQEEGQRIIDANEYQELRNQLSAAKNENIKLRQESLCTQQEVGEVLIMAQKQANMMIEKARLNAQKLKEEAEREARTIVDRTKDLSIEVEESRQTMMEIYSDLQKRIDRLSQEEIYQHWVGEES